jgi:NAD(P)-dependent dehydrogenase (short-subunit alcohol dehydrogenase family)
MTKVAVIAGVGPGISAASARRFAAAGYRVALLARRRDTLDPLASETGGRAYPCDVTSPESVTQTFAAIRKDLGEVEVLVYNAGGGMFADVEHITPDEFEASWRVNAFGALLSAQAVIPAMKTAGRGSIVFIGATASRRGGPRSAAFAPAKAAQRALAESMARSPSSTASSIWSARAPACPTSPTASSFSLQASPRPSISFAYRTAAPGASRSRRGRSARLGELQPEKGDFDE